MKNRRARLRSAAAGIVAAALVLLPALAGARSVAGEATDFPSQTIRWVVPFPAAGSIDSVARVVSKRISEILGQPIIIDNRAGAGGRVGSKLVADAKPDGYTQLFTLNTTYTMDKALFKNLAYDPDQAFEPVSIIAQTSQILVVSPTLPARDVKELIALVKAHPHEFNYASSGVGGSLHLAMLYFQSLAGLDMVHVPYKGGPPAVQDLIAGRVSMMFFNTPAAAPYIHNHQIRALGVSTAQRSAYLPDVPTIAESGVPGFDIAVWFGLSVPSGTPAAVVDRMQRAVAQALQDPQVKKELDNLGAEPVGDTPKEFAARIKSESATWSKVFKDTHMTLE
jgi:tripartite-type tricarboxylate transporter receptor subunit TctC